MMNSINDIKPIHGNYDMLNEPLLDRNIDIQFIYYLNCLLVCTTLLFIFILFLSFLLSLLIELNHQFVYYFLIYGIFIIIVDCFAIGNYNKTHEQLKLSKYELTFENKLTSLLFIFGISFFISTIFYLFNFVSWFIAISLLINVSLSLIYIYNIFSTTTNIDYVSEKIKIKTNIFKINLITTLFVSISQLIINKNFTETILIILLNALLSYIYVNQITFVLNNSEDFYNNEKPLFYSLFYNVIHYCSEFKIENIFPNLSLSN